MGRCIAAFMIALALAVLGGCGGGRSENVSCEDLSVCPEGMQCSSVTKECEAVSTIALASAVGTADAPVAVTVIKPDGSSCEAARCTGLPLGSRVTFRASEAPGWRFLGWSGVSPECTGGALELVIASLQADALCVAHYVRRLRVTAVDASGEGGVSARSEAPFAACAGLSCEVDLGSEVVLTASEREGRRFRGFRGAGCGESPALTLTVTPRSEDVTCTADYVDRFAISGSAAGAEEVELTVQAQSETAHCEPRRCIVDRGTAVTLTAPGVPRFRFAGWSGSATCTGAEPVLRIADVAASEACTANYVARRTVSASSQGLEPLPVIATRSDDAFAACMPGSCEVDRGGTVTLVAPTAEGYRLSGWSGPMCEGQLAVALALHPVTDDFTCVASYVQGIAVAGALLGAEGEVSASSSTPFAQCAGGSCVIDLGGAAALTAPTLPERRFLGWEGDPGCVGQEPTIAFENVTASRTCYARYATRHQVSGVVAPAGVASVRASSASTAASCAEATCTLDAGGEVTLEAVASEGQRFTGWSGGGACMGEAPTLQLADVRANLTCSASFVRRVVVAGSAAPAAGGSVVASSGAPAALCGGAACTVDVGARVVLRATPETGYRFAGWSGCAGAGEPAITLDSVQESVSCQANFELVRVSVSATVTPPESGSVVASSGAAGASCAGAGCSVFYGSAVTLAASPAPGYRFARWSGCAETSEPTLTLASVTAERACQASFTRIRVTVAASVTPAAGGTVTASSPAAGAACNGASCTVDWGSDVALVASAAADHRFVGFSGCGESASATLPLARVTADTTCTATFELLRYTITVARNVAGGTVAITSPAPSCSGASCAKTVVIGSPVTIQATPEEGYAFQGWVGCGGLDSARTVTLNVNADLVCTANFVPAYTLRVQALHDTREGYVSMPAGSYALAVSSSATPACSAASCTLNQGQAATLTASAANGSGYRFDRWECTGTVYESRSSQTMLSPGADTVCTALFLAPITYYVVGYPYLNGAYNANLLANISATSSAAWADCSGNSCSVLTNSAVTLAASLPAEIGIEGWTCTSGQTTTNYQGSSITLSVGSAGFSCNARFYTVLR